MATDGVCRMDPNNPNVKALVAFAQEIWWEYVQTHTLEDVMEMKRQNAINRELRQRIFGGRVHQRIQTTAGD